MLATMTWATIACVAILIIIGYLYYQNRQWMEKMLARMDNTENEEQAIIFRKTVNGYHASYTEIIITGDYAVRKPRQRVFKDMPELIKWTKEYWGIVEEPVFSKLSLEDQITIKNIYKKY